MVCKEPSRILLMVETCTKRVEVLPSSQSVGARAPPSQNSPTAATASLPSYRPRTGPKAALGGMQLSLLSSSYTARASILSSERDTSYSIFLTGARPVFGLHSCCSWSIVHPACLAQTALLLPQEGGWSTYINNIPYFNLKLITA